MRPFTVLVPRSAAAARAGIPVATGGVDAIVVGAGAIDDVTGTVVGRGATVGRGAGSAAVRGIASATVPPPTSRPRARPSDRNTPAFDAWMPITISVRHCGQ